MSNIELSPLAPGCLPSTVRIAFKRTSLTQESVERCKPEHRQRAIECNARHNQAESIAPIDAKALTDNCIHLSIEIRFVSIHFFFGLQWQKYLDAIAKADCAAALKRVITAPPPENVKDAGLPCKDNGLNEEVQEFWFASSQSTVSAKLTDSLSGDAKLAFWLEKQEFLRIQEEMEAKQQADEKAKASATQPQSEQPQKSS